MDDLKQIISKNIIELRKQYEYTQMELAEKLNYSDKAVSKWERGESLPDITVLKEIADIFQVSVDYLITKEHEDKSNKIKKVNKRKKYNHGLITGMSILLVWLVATTIFVITQLTASNVKIHWTSFIIAVPVSFIVWLIFNSIWFNSRMNFLIISLLMWSVLFTLFACFFMYNINIGLIFALGVFGQAIIIMWSRIKKPKDNG